MSSGRIAVFGGTFNPPHNGHIRYAQAALEQFGFDRMLIIPTAIPPHKEYTSCVTPQQRLSMCELAFCDGRFTVSDLELRRNGKSYTVDTLVELRRLYPSERLYLLIGADMLMCFEKWYRYEEVLNTAALVVTCREGGERQRRDVSEKAAWLKAKGAEVLLCSFEPYPISSTEIRSMISDGVSISDYVPDEVNQYILNGGLYRDRT